MSAIITLVGLGLFCLWLAYPDHRFCLPCRVSYWLDKLGGLD